TTMPINGEIHGNGGDDSFRIVSPFAEGSILIDGGSGNNELRYNAWQGEIGDWLVSGQYSGTVMGDIIEFENIQSIVSASNNGDVFRVEGVGRMDTIEGYLGSAEFYLATGSIVDQIIGGVDPDLFVIAEGAVVGSIDGGAGNDTIDLSALTSLGEYNFDTGAETGIN